MPDGSENAGDGRTRLAPWVSAVAAAVPAAVLIISLSLGQIEGLGMVALAALPWAVVIAWPSWPHHRYVLAAALSVAFIAFAIYARWGQGNAGPTDNTAQLRAAASHLKFLEPAEPIPHCVTFNGTGSIPANDDLVLFDRPSNRLGDYTHTPAFGYDGPVSVSGGGWIAPDLDIGSGGPSDNGTHIAIVALLVPRGVAHFLDDLTSDSSTGQVPSSVMNLGVQAAKIVTTRNSQNAHC